MGRRIFFEVGLLEKLVLILFLFFFLSYIRDERDGVDDDETMITGHTLEKDFVLISCIFLYK